MIISNPPYISRFVNIEILNALKFEPTLALIPEGGDENIFYKLIARDGMNALESKGYCYLELNEFTAGEVKVLFEKSGWQNVEIRNDLQDNQRMLFAGKSLQGNDV